jgi:YNFM family putative membrane transporter
MSGIELGTPAYRRASLALFLAGFCTFSLLYCVQPLLPDFARHFHITPAVSSLALSFATGSLAFAIFLMGALSQSFSRRNLMFVSMTLAAICNLAIAFASGWNSILLARLCEGLALGGVPAVAMVWLAEEIHPDHLGKAMGLYVAGTAFGGMMGRVGMGVLTEFASWRMAMGIMGAVCLLAAIGFAILLPASRNFSPKPAGSPRYHLIHWGKHLRNRNLLRLFLIGFISLSIFVATFNYVGFRLSQPPYLLGQATLGLIYLTYGSGLFVPPWAGHIADRIGGRIPIMGSFAIMALGAIISLATPLPLIILGTSLVAAGFFAAHAIASGWVGQLAGDAKSHAASLYLLFYYLGSSISGLVGGWVWQGGGWSAVVNMILSLACTGAALASAMPAISKRRSRL